jgi:hypothetical protein
MHLHIIHKSEHNINITCLFALAEKQFVMRALAEWNRSLGDPVSLCILHGLHARRKSLTQAFNIIKKKFCCLSQVMVGHGQSETTKNQSKDFPELLSEAM